MSDMKLFTVRPYYLENLDGSPTTLEQRVVQSEEIESILPHAIGRVLDKQPNRSHFGDPDFNISYERKERMGYWPNLYALRKLLPFSFLERNPDDLHVANFGPAGKSFKAKTPCILAYSNGGAGSYYEGVHIASSVQELEAAPVFSYSIQRVTVGGIRSGFGHDRLTGFSLFGRPTPATEFDYRHAIEFGKALVEQAANSREYDPQAALQQADTAVGKRPDYLADFVYAPPRGKLVRALSWRPFRAEAA